MSDTRDHRDHRGDPPPEPPSQPPPTVRDHRGEPPSPPPDSPREVRDHRGEPPLRPAPEHEPEPGFGDVVRDHRASGIKHIFVLMLENRSFDHMLGFSAISGTDAKTGEPTTIDGLTGSESNQFEGQTYTVTTGAADVMGSGPSHNFDDVLEQLCGAGAVYPRGGAYPPIDNSGYVSSYAKVAGRGAARQAMACFAPEQLPVLNALAREFVVCDRWFSSMPGPTEPNRMFVHAASSGNFDDSPTSEEIIESIFLPGGGIEFEHGTIYSRLDKAGIKYRIYGDDHTPNAAELADVSVWSIREFEDLAHDLQDDDFDAGYVFIEPNYDALDSFEDGNSQHPSGSVAAGERFIKATYETIRSSPLWPDSLLIITWDEHGGFYDHVAPPAAEPTGEVGRSHGFTFAQLGPRVPALVVSPLVPKNLIEHRQFDHTSVLSTVERVFNLPQTLQGRDAHGNGVNHLAGLATPRLDAPMTLPAATVTAAVAMRRPLSEAVVRRPDALVTEDRHGNIAALISSAVAQQLKVAPPSEREAIVERAKQLHTHADVLAYLKEVELAVTTARASGAVA
jgi:phospholipase C